MRTIYKIAGIVAAVLLLNSCEDFLEKEPLDFLSPDYYYTDVESVNKGIIGIYDALQSSALYGQFLVFQFVGNTDIESFNRDIFGTNGRTTQMNVCAHNPDNSELYQTWTALYDGVGRANSLIAQIPDVEMADSLKSRYLAEAKALRGLFYFHLAVNWQDVPLRTEPVTSPKDIHIGATPQKEVFTQVLEDLEYAAKYLPSPTQMKSSELGRMTNTATMALLARLNLYMAGYPLKERERYDDVIKWTQLIIAESYHQLNPDFHQVFRNHCQDIYDPKENLFEVFFYGNTLGSYSETGQIGAFNGIKSDDQNTTGFSYGLMYVSPYLFELYKKSDLDPNAYAYDKKEFTQTNFPGVNDTRATRVIGNFYYRGTGEKVFYPNQYANKYPGKWRREEELVLPKSKNLTPTNFPVVRYSDVLLMLSEAYNSKLGAPNDSAYWAINEVRRRAFKQPAGQSSLFDVPAGLSGSDFHQWIRDERARELCFEGVRKMDLVRWGDYVEHIKTVVQTFPNFEKRNAPTSGVGSLANENIGRSCQIYDFIQDKHNFQPIPQRELGINNKLKQHSLW